MRILIASKKSALRHALQRLLNIRPGYDEVITVSNKERLLTQVEDQSPDLIILDEDISKLLVADVIKPLQQNALSPLIIVLGLRASVKEAYFDAGVMSFVNKNDPPKSLLTAIEACRFSN